MHNKSLFLIFQAVFLIVSGAASYLCFPIINSAPHIYFLGLLLFFCVLNALTYWIAPWLFRVATKATPLGIKDSKELWVQTKKIQVLSGEQSEWFVIEGRESGKGKPPFLRSGKTVYLFRENFNRGFLRDRDYWMSSGFKKNKTGRVSLFYCALETLLGQSLKRLGGSSH